MDDNQVEVGEEGRQPPMLRRRLALLGRKALVTSSARGMGRAIAVRLARAGCIVAVNAQFRVDCQSVVGEIEAFGAAAIIAEGSIETSEGCSLMWRESVARLGHIDVLVNSGGNDLLGRPVATEREDRIWEANLFGPLRLAGLVAEGGMRSPGGAIVNVAAVPTAASDPLLSAYRTSQAALVSATRALALTLAPAGIRVNVIATQVGDDTVAQVMSGPHPAKAEARIIAGGPASDDDVAATVLYLASDASAPATGIVFTAEAHID